MIPFWRNWLAAANSTTAPSRKRARLRVSGQAFAAWAISTMPASALLANITSFQTMP